MRRCGSLALAVLLIAPFARPVAAERGKAAATTIVWWSQDSPPYVAANKALVASFEKTHPAIKVTYQYFPYDVYLKKLITAYASHTQPDVAQISGAWVTSYIKAGQIAQVPPTVMAPAQIAKTYWPAALGAYTYHGHYYGLPQEFNLENGGMLINTQLWKQAGLHAYPRTWAELTADAKKLTRYDNHGNILRAGIGTMDPADDYTFIPLSMLLQQGGTYFAKDRIHVTLTSPAMVKATTAFTDWYLKDKVASYALDNNPNAVGQGRIAITYGGPWIVPQIKASYPKLPIAYVPMPSFTGSPPYFAAQSGWGEVVANASTHKDAAWTFVSYVSTKANARAWNITTGEVPARRDLTNDEQILKAQPSMATSFRVLRYGRWIGDLQNLRQFYDTMQKWINAIQLHKDSVSQALTNCEHDVNQMIDSDLNNL